MHRSVRHAVPRTVPLRVDGAHGGESAFLSDEHSTACRLDLCAGLSIPVEVFMHYVCSKDEAKVLMLLHTRARALDEAERLRTEELENGVAIRAAMVECARAVHRTSVARGEGAGLYGRCAIDLKLGTLAGTEIVLRSAAARHQHAMHHHDAAVERAWDRVAEVRQQLEQYISFNRLFVARPRRGKEAERRCVLLRLEEEIAARFTLFGSYPESRQSVEELIAMRLSWEDIAESKEPIGARALLNPPKERQEHHAASVSELTPLRAKRKRVGVCDEGSSRKRKRTTCNAQDMAVAVSSDSDNDVDDGENEIAVFESLASRRLQRAVKVCTPPERRAVAELPGASAGRGSAESGMTEKAKAPKMDEGADEEEGFVGVMAAQSMSTPSDQHDSDMDVECITPVAATERSPHEQEESMSDGQDDAFSLTYGYEDEFDECRSSPSRRHEDDGEEFAASGRTQDLRMKRTTPHQHGNGGGDDDGMNDVDEGDLDRDDPDELDDGDDGDDESIEDVAIPSQLIPEIARHSSGSHASSSGTRGAEKIHNAESDEEAPSLSPRSLAHSIQSVTASLLRSSIVSPKRASRTKKSAHGQG